MGILPWAHIKFPIVDLAEMVYQVRRLQLGYVPYRDTFTHHFLGFIIPSYALGSAITLTPLVLKAMTLVFNFATAVLVWLILREVSRPQVAWLGAVLTVTLGWFWSWQGFGFNVQSSLTPVIAAVLLLVIRACIGPRESSLYWAAAWSGVLAICDQRAFVFLALLPLPFLFVSDFRRWRVACLAVLSLIIVPASAAGYLWQAGAWNDFVEQTLVFPLFYRNHGVPFALVPWLSSGLGTFIGGERIAVPLMLTGLGAAFFIEPRRVIKAVWVVSVICAASYAILGGRAYPNYFLVFAPIALVLISLIPSYFAARWPAAGKAVAVSLVALSAMYALRPGALLIATGSVFVPADERTLDTVADFLRTRTSSQDGVLVWGYAPAIYVLSERFRTFRDMGLLSITGGNFGSSSGDAQGLLPHMVREFDDYLTYSPPRIIAIYRVTREPCPGKGLIQRNLDYQNAPYLKRLRDVIAASYRSELIVDGSCDHAEVFVLRNSAER